MMLITGPLWSGKRDFACRLLGCTRQELACRAVWDVQALAAGCGTDAELEALAGRLAGYEAVILTEEGGGVVPADPAVRAAREAAGRLGRTVIWALSLPGKVAPVTAGAAIKNTIYNMLHELGA